MDEEGGVEEGEELVDKDNEDDVLDVGQARVVEICLDHLGGRAGQDGGEWHCVCGRVLLVNEENGMSKEKVEERMSEGCLFLKGRFRQGRREEGVDCRFVVFVVCLCDMNRESREKVFR